MKQLHAALMILMCSTFTLHATDSTPESSQGAKIMVPALVATPQLMSRWKENYAQLQPTRTLKIVADNPEIADNVKQMQSHFPKNTQLFQSPDGSFATVIPITVTLGQLNYAQVMINCSERYPDAYHHLCNQLIPRDKALTSKLRFFNGLLPKATQATENRVQVICSPTATGNPQTLLRSAFPHSIPLSFLPHIEKPIIVTLETITFCKKRKKYFVTTLVQLTLDTEGKKRSAELQKELSTSVKLERKTES